jgi:hypothetical protein
MNLTGSTVTTTGSFGSGSTADLVQSTLTSSGALAITGALTAANSTVTANAGGSVGSVSLTDSKFINTGALTTTTGIALNGSVKTSTLELHGGSISGGPISGEGGIIRATSGVTIANTTATFTGLNPVGLRARYISTGTPGSVYKGQTQAGILAIETLNLNQAEAILTGPLSFLPYQAADATISAFFGGVPTEPTQFAIGFFGNFTAPTTGTYQMQVAQVDDDAGFWIDLDFDGVFEIAGANGNELIAQQACCGDSPAGSVNLVAGQVYKVGIAVEDGQGGSSIVGRIGLPGGPLEVVDPNGANQTGLWTYGVPNQVIVDAGAGLQINRINGSVNVISNGDLDIVGPLGNTMDSLTIGAGGMVTLGGAGPSAAAAPVPEPGTLAFLLAGALGCLTRRQRSPRA